MRVAIAVLALLIAGGMAWIRLAPADAARWHVVPVPPEISDTNGQIIAEEGGARAALTVAERSPEDVLARLDAIALQTPRTMRLDGSPEDGLITWVTRSAVFGFPDYSTAAARSEGPATVLTLHARLRFGRSDLGVNAARLRDWLGQLTAR